MNFIKRATIPEAIPLAERVLAINMKVETNDIMETMGDFVRRAQKLAIIDYLDAMSDRPKPILHDRK